MPSYFSRISQVREHLQKQYGHARTAWGPLVHCSSPTWPTLRFQASAPATCFFCFAAATSSAPPPHRQIDNRIR
uniref:Uncharacterized protein n=1 Tax=Oryza brachyantha TaxID=4533 RepID=J3N3E8_ORYBR